MIGWIQILLDWTMIQIDNLDGSSRNCAARACPGTNAVSQFLFCILSVHFYGNKTPPTKKNKNFSPFDDMNLKIRWILNFHDFWGHFDKVIINHKVKFWTLPFQKHKYLSIPRVLISLRISQRPVLKLSGRDRHKSFKDIGIGHLIGSFGQIFGRNVQF